MNIYMITEDGVMCCIRAKTMHEAIKVCEDCYIEDVMEENEKGHIDTSEDIERKYYHLEILQSCELIGELKN